MKPCKSPGIEAMKAERRPGHCMCCDEELPYKAPNLTGRNRLICGSKGCKKLYQEAYGIDRRERARLERERKRVQALDKEYLAEFREWARGGQP